MIKVFILTVVIHFSSGYSGTMTSEQYYFPTAEACNLASSRWKKKYPFEKQFRVVISDCEVGYIPK